jgi:very-short-patch-repair endonuclease
MAIFLSDLSKAGFVLRGNTLVRETAPARHAKRAPRPRNANILEDRFFDLWRKLGGPELEREFRFFPARRWRADFAHQAARVLIEVEGGLYGRGRHNCPEGYAKDVEKYNQASLLGFQVFRVTSKMITAETLAPIIEACQPYLMP